MPLYPTIEGLQPDLNYPGTVFVHPLTGNRVKIIRSHDFEHDSMLAGEIVTYDGEIIDFDITIIGTAVDTIRRELLDDDTSERIPAINIYQEKTEGQTPVGFTQEMYQSASITADFGFYDSHEQYVEPFFSVQYTHGHGIVRIGSISYHCAENNLFIDGKIMENDGEELEFDDLAITITQEEGIVTVKVRETDWHFIATFPGQLWQDLTRAITTDSPQQMLQLFTEIGFSITQ